LPGTVGWQDVGRIGDADPSRKLPLLALAGGTGGTHLIEPPRAAPLPSGPTSAASSQSPR
jgi:hypothetical protein